MGINDSSIKVALAFCDPHGTYSQHAAAAMASIFANTQSEVCVYIIHDDTLTEENRSKLQKTAEDFRQTAEFINVEKIFDAAVMDMGEVTADLTRGSLFRLLIPRLIGCSRIIYLDCDVIVNLDLREMWEADIGGCALGVVRDVWSLDHLKGIDVPWRLALAYKAMGVDKDKYFNSGVLLMDLGKIRKDYDFFAEVAAFNKKYRKAVTMADQDCLNHIFAGDVFLMDVRFNCIRREDLPDSDGLAAIWHMAAGAKPWNSYSRPGVDELYWHYLAMTPYASGSEKLVTTMLKSLSSHRYIHEHSADCVKRIKKQLADNILRAHLWTVPYLYFILLANRFGRAKKPR